MYKMLKGREPATLALRATLIHGTMDYARTRDHYSLAASRGGDQLGTYSG